MGQSRSQTNKPQNNVVGKVARRLFKDGLESNTSIDSTLHSVTKTVVCPRKPLGKR